jgi:hypothetical protein
MNCNKCGTAICEAIWVEAGNTLLCRSCAGEMITKLRDGDEITRLRAIVEPLDAAMATYHHVVIRHPNGSGQYLVETFGDDGVELYGWGDTLPEALAAAAAGRSETDGN